MKSSEFKTAAWLVAILVMTLIGFAGIGVFVWQCFLWLRDGFWTSYDFRDIWTWFGGGQPEFAWSVVNNVANLILDAPVFTTAIAAAAAMSKMLPEQLEERRKRRKRSARGAPAASRAKGTQAKTTRAKTTRARTSRAAGRS